MSSRAPNLSMHFANPEPELSWQPLRSLTELRAPTHTAVEPNLQRPHGWHLCTALGPESLWDPPVLWNLLKYLSTEAPAEMHIESVIGLKYIQGSKYQTTQISFKYRHGKQGVFYHKKSLAPRLKCPTSPTWAHFHKLFTTTSKVSEKALLPVCFQHKPTKHLVSKLP